MRLFRAAMAVAAALGLAVATQAAHAADGAAMRVVEVGPAADAPMPAIGVRRGGVTTLSFADRTGRPWPVAELIGPDDGWLRFRRVPSHPHTIALTSAGRGRDANLAAFLDGLDAPLHLEFSTKAEAPPQVQVRVARPGRDADDALLSAGGTASARQVPAGEDLDAAIRDYLLNNPEVLREALDPRRQLAANAARLRGELFGAEEAPAAGDLDGPVTVVEFFDYRCGYCKRALAAVRSVLERPGVRLELREFPILGADSERTARAALAAERQGRYLQAHLALMAREDGLDQASIEAAAAEAGLDVARLLADMDAPEIGERIDANKALAARLGVTGTPAFLLAGPGGVRVSPGALDADRLHELIDAVAAP